MQLLTHNYYFVVTSLPSLQIGSDPEISFEEFVQLLKDNLTKEDYEQTEVLRRYEDILNIRAFLKGEELDYHGNFDVNALEEALLDQANLPDYVLNYLATYEHKDQRLEHFPELISAFFREESQHAHGFLKEYLKFERELRLVLTAFRAKQLHRDLLIELQYEDPEEDLIAQLLSQKDEQTFTPPESFEDLQTIFELYGQSPLALYQALCEYRFNKIAQMIYFEVFSFNLVLGYMAQLMIVEKWTDLDKKIGSEVVSKIIKDPSL